MTDWNCYRCGEPGHVSAECPTRGSKSSSPALADAAPEHCLKCGSKGVHHPNCGQPPAAPEWIRKILETFGFERGGAVVDSPFRRAGGIAPSTEVELKRMARAQVATARAGREHPEEEAA